MRLRATRLTAIAHAARRVVAGYSPLTLFAAGEPGVWYDPSDMSTMFQDAAGTTPVTAVEQPVGLILDKSKGLVLGPELVTNGDFSSGTTGWTAGNSTLSVSDGFLVITNISNSAGSALQAISTIVGRTYKLTCTFVQVTSSQVYLQVGTTQGAFNLGFDTKTTASGTLQVIFTAVDTTSYIGAFVAPFVAGRASRFDNISVRELPGNHATQTTATSRPVLKQDGNGKYYLRFDGVDDWLVTPTITPGIDKAQVFAGVRKLSDATRGVILESRGSIDTNNGALLLTAPDGASSTYAWDSKGTAIAEAIGTGFAAPITSVLTGLGDIAGDSAILRVNGTQAAQSTADQGTGNYLANQLCIGRRAGTSLPANINLYGLIVRFGDTLPAQAISDTETWLNGKTRAYA